MYELDRRGQLVVIVAVVSAEPGGCQCQHRPDALAARVHQMRRDLGNAGGILRQHPGADQPVDGIEVLAQNLRQPFMRLCQGIGIQAHHTHVRLLDKCGSLALCPSHERAHAQQRPYGHRLCQGPT